jgi:hypothetical protein
MNAWWTMIDWITYQLICRTWDHRPGAWFPANGPEGTMARMCNRCLATQHKIQGVKTEWTR